MHTLFGPNILSGSPVPDSSPPSEPLGLSFTSSKATSSTATNSAASSYTNPARFTSLTSNLQDGSHFDDSRESTSKRASMHRRKGNPKLLMMGQRRSGKSSITSVVFQNMPPDETLFLESTNTVKEITLRTCTNFEVLELPSHVTSESLETDHKALFASVGAVIWVIDVQDEYLSSIAALVKTAAFLEAHHPRVNLEVLVHKTDGLSEEYRYDASREVRQRVQDELSDVGLGSFNVGFHQTSIYDHSVFEAMSKIIQKLLMQLQHLEALLNRLCSTCGMQKAFLFDTTTKLFIATDASPTFLPDYEACSDYLDVLVDLKALYSWNQRSQPAQESLGEDTNNLGESLVTFEKSGDAYIYAKELTEYLSLVCILSKGSGVEKRILIDYNVSVLQDAVIEVFSV